MTQGQIFVFISKATLSYIEDKVALVVKVGFRGVPKLHTAIFTLRFYYHCQPHTISAEYFGVPV